MHSEPEILPEDLELAERVAARWNLDDLTNIKPREVEQPAPVCT